jgi:hypothetical protein
VKRISLYVANDGTKFNNEKECISYEYSLRNGECFCIICCPDTTEGRGYCRNIFVQFNDINVEYHLLLLEKWCNEVMKNPVDFVMNVNPVGKYKIIQINNDEYCQCKAITGVGDYSATAIQAIVKFNSKFDIDLIPIKYRQSSSNESSGQLTSDIPEHMQSSFVKDKEGA